MRCPICRKSVEPEGTHRPPTFPFCSDRCKLIDLGRWLSGKYSIPVDPDEGATEGDAPSKDEPK